MTEHIIIFATIIIIVTAIDFVIIIITIILFQLIIFFNVYFRKWIFNV